MTTMGRPTSRLASPSSKQIRASNESFRAQAEVVGNHVRTAFAELIGLLPGGIRRAKDLQESLGLDNALGWKLYRTATATEDLESLRFVPTPATLESALAAFTARGVPESATHKVRAACQEFETLVRKHASSRRDFDTLLLGIDEKPAESSLLRERREAFRVNRTLWGLQADVRVLVGIFAPNASPDGVAAAAIGGWVGLHQTRKDVPFSIDATVLARYPSESGVATVRNNGLVLMEEFSSISSDDLVPGVTADGKPFTELNLDDVGPTANASIFLVHMRPDKTKMHAESSFGSGTLVSVPTRLLHLDLLVASGFSDPLTVRVETMGRPSNITWVMEEYRTRDLIPTSERAVHIPGVSQPPKVEEIVQYPKLVRQVIQDMGCGDTTFDLYRCSMQYPILHTLVRVYVNGKIIAIAPESANY